MEYKTNTQMTI